MRSIGIRELKARASQVIRELRIHGGEVHITHHGRVVQAVREDRRDL